jgi:hypothetical protein
MADWTDLIAENNAASSPETTARTGLLNQQTVLMQQQAQEAAMKNRILSLQLQYQQALPRALAASMSGSGSQTPTAGEDSGFSEVQTPEPGSEDSGFSEVQTPEPGSNASGSSPAAGDITLNPAAAVMHMQARYAPVPAGVYTPAEQSTMAMAALSGNPATVDLVKQQHQMRVDAINQTRAKAAQQQYNDLYAITTAPEGRAFDALSLVDPDEAARLKQAGATDDDVRHFAAKLAGALHVGAQLPVEYRKDGVAVDKTSQQEVPGYDTAVGLGPDERVALTKAATENVDTFENGAAAKKPRWQVEGASSASDWIQQHATLAQTMSAGLPSPSGAPNAAVQFFNGGAVPPAGAPPPQQQQAPQGGQAPIGPPSTQRPPQQPALPSPAPVDPVMRQALSDTSYRLSTPTIPRGQSATPAQGDQQKATVAARTDLLKDSADATSSAAQSLQYLQAAKAVMATQSKSAPAGLSAPAQAIVSRAADALGIGGDYATRYQELAKYLGNSALASAKQTYGARMTQSEVGLQLNELSPSTKMTDAAINDLLDTNVRNAQYTIATARRVRPYLTAGNDPQSFAEFNEQYFPRAQTVNGPTPSASLRGDRTGADNNGGFVVGRRYRDAQGRTAVYMANGQWQ